MSTVSPYKQNYIYLINNVIHINSFLAYLRQPERYDMDVQYSKNAINEHTINAVKYYRIIRDDFPSEFSLNKANIIPLIQKEVLQYLEKHIEIPPELIKPPSPKDQESSDLVKLKIFIGDLEKRVAFIKKEQNNYNSSIKTAEFILKSVELFNNISLKYGFLNDTEKNKVGKFIPQMFIKFLEGHKSLSLDTQAKQPYSWTKLINDAVIENSSASTNYKYLYYKYKTKYLQLKK